MFLTRSSEFGAWLTSIIETFAFSRARVGRVGRWVKSSGIAKVSTFYPLDSIEDGAAKSQVCSAQPLSPLPLEEAPSFRRHISEVKMAGGRKAVEEAVAAELLLAAISTSLLPSFPTQLCSSSYSCPARRPRRARPSFISVQTKAPKWLECLRQMAPLPIQL